MPRIYKEVEVTIDVDDVLPEVDTEDLIEELEARGYRVQRRGAQSMATPDEDAGYTLRRDAERAYFAMHAGDMDVVRDFIADAAGRIQ